MHAIERRPNHFRFQALTSTPTNFHPSLIRSKLPSKPKFRRKSARLDRGSAQLFPRAAVKNRIGAGRGASTLRLTSGRKQTESPHGAGNPPKRATSLLKFVKLYPPHHLRLFVHHSIFYLLPSTLPFVRIRFVEKGDGKWRDVFFLFFGREIEEKFRRRFRLLAKRRMFWEQMDGMLLLRETDGILTNEKINEQRASIRVWLDYILHW